MSQAVRQPKALGAALGKIVALAEAYPDLKAKRELRRAAALTSKPSKVRSRCRAVITMVLPVI